MKILAFDTATEACSAALWQDGQVLARFEEAGRSHTERLQPMVQGLMAEAGLNFGQLDGIACGVGPGSFAGVRIGVGFAKGLALARDLPVVGITSLQMLARGAMRQGAVHVAAVIDARMDEVYYGVYVASAEGGPCPLAVEQVCAPRDVRLPEPGAWTGAGSGWKTYPEVLAQACGGQVVKVDAQALPRAEDALPMAVPQFRSGQAHSADQLSPVYLRNKVALTLLEQADLRRRNSG